MRAPGRNSLLAAGALHAVAVVLVALTPQAPPPAAPEDETSEVDLEEPSESEPAALPEPVVAPLPDDAPAHVRAPALAKQAPPKVAEPSVAAAQAESEMAAEPRAVAPERVEPEPLPRFRWTTEAPVDPNALGIGDKNPFLASGGGAGDGTHEAPARGGEMPADDKAAERNIRAGLHAHDRALGLGAAGPVVAVAESVARTSIAAVESRAVIEVVTDRDGNVVSVTLGDVSEDRAGWTGVAAAIRAALRSQKLRVPPGTNGVAMTVEIVSRESMPSGASPGVRVTVFDTAVKDNVRGKGPATTVAILPRVRIPIQGGPTIVLPIPLPIIAGMGDPVDIAAPAQRSVHAHVLSERDL